MFPLQPESQTEVPAQPVVSHQREGYESVYTRSYYHVRFHPCVIIKFLPAERSSEIPFIDHTQSPRKSFDRRPLKKIKADRSTYLSRAEKSCHGSPYALIGARIQTPRAGSFSETESVAGAKRSRCVKILSVCSAGITAESF